ncbi:MAG: hypothetical protein ACRDL5_00335 [Solirubrobacteraceae bacterium]
MPRFPTAQHQFGEKLPGCGDSTHETPSSSTREGERRRTHGPAVVAPSRTG